MTALEESSVPSYLEDPYVSKEIYISADWADREAQKLWTRVWQIACREEELDVVGDFVVYEIVDQSIVIVRTEEGLKAFYNTCLHRGTQLKFGQGNAKELRCRYHAWRWNLDGSIKDVVDDFDFAPACTSAAALALPEVHVDTWGGFVFINLDRDAVPLLEYLSPVPEDLARFNFEKLRLTRKRTTIIKANWKTGVNAFSDSYHSSGTHPQLLRYMDDSSASWEYEPFGKHGSFRSKSGTFGRPSPRLGQWEVDKAEMVVAMSEDNAEVGVTTPEQLDLIRQMAESIPEEVSISTFMAQLKRQQLSAEGIDAAAFTDDELMSSTIRDWVIFPNICTPRTPTELVVFRFRPRWKEPEECYMDVWDLRLFAPDQQPVAPVADEFYEDVNDHDWGRILNQDMGNIPNVQRGMHAHGFERLICGRQDWNTLNLARWVEAYVAD